MVSFALILTAACIFVLLLLIIYALIYSRENLKLSSTGENQKLTYSTQPSMSIITKQLSYPTNTPNLYHSSNTKLNKQQFNQVRSHSLANNLYITKSSNRRRSSIIDSKQIAQIEFSLPPTAEKYRRRSLAICNNISESKHTTISSIIQTMESKNVFLPCLISFSIYYFESSQIKIEFQSLTSLPSTAQLQQLNIEVKLIPDGKMKCLTIKKYMENENIFSQDNNENFIQFSNISSARLHSKAILMKFYGKDQAKKTIQLGKIGKIYFNQIDDFQNEKPIKFIHEVEIFRMVRIKDNIILFLEAFVFECNT